jgi:hypothetical protein
MVYYLLTMTSSSQEFVLLYVHNYITLSYTLLRLKGLYSLVIVLCLTFTGCAASFLSTEQRLDTEAQLYKIIQDIQKKAPMPEHTLVNALTLLQHIYAQVPTLKHRLDVTQNEDLAYLGVKRVGFPKIGDILIFRSLPHSLRFAMVSKVHTESSYQALSIMGHKLFILQVNVARPHQRYYNEHIINSFVRKVTPQDQAPFLYLAGESIQEIRALF